MALTWSPAVNRNDDETGVEPRDFRVALEGLLVREGLLSGSPATLVQGTAGWAYQINGEAWWATRRATGDGLHVWGNDGAITVGESTTGEDAQGGTVPSAPASGLERIDIIWVMQPSNGEAGDTTSTPRAGVAVGDPGAVAIAPAIPTGATEVARNTMLATATSTSSSGNTIAQTMPWTATKGGVVHCRTQGELTALASLASADNPVYGEVLGTVYVCRDGLTWLLPGSTAPAAFAAAGGSDAVGAFGPKFAAVTATPYDEGVTYEKSAGVARVNGVASVVTALSGGETIAWLPVGFRPSATADANHRRRFIVKYGGTGVGTVEVTGEGKILAITATGAGDTIALDGISFPVRG